MKNRCMPIAFAMMLLLAGPAAAAVPQGAAPAEVPAPQQKAVRGKVLESISGAGYTYLLIEEGQAKTWAAIPESKVELGQEVAVQPGMVMHSFESKALRKTFEQIIFSPGLEDVGGHAAGIEGGTPQPAGKEKVDDATLAALSGGSSRAIVPAGDELKVNKAEGGNARTVEECFAEAEKLNKQVVRVQGKVVKFSPMIMGKNWLHLQDGTGDPMKNTHDLVVTMQEEAAKDAIVVVEGTLSKDKDFGAGYRYDAIIEDAKIVK